MLVIPITFANCPWECYTRFQDKSLPTTSANHNVMLTTSKAIIISTLGFQLCSACTYFMGTMYSNCVTVKGDRNSPLHTCLTIHRRNYGHRLALGLLEQGSHTGWQWSPPKKRGGILGKSRYWQKLWSFSPWRAATFFWRRSHFVNHYFSHLPLMSCIPLLFYVADHIVCGHGALRSLLTDNNISPSILLRVERHGSLEDYWKCIPETRCTGLQWEKWSENI